MQVPMTDSPSVAPASTPANYSNVQGITPDAFGAGIGRSISGVGDEISKHVVALQTIKNEAEARDLTVQTETSLGAERSKLMQLTGKDALNYQPTYVANVQKIRQDALAGASNGAVSRMLDQQIAKSTGYALIDGQSHIGQQAKVYDVQTSAARVGAAKNDAAQAPDDVRFDDSLNKIRAEVPNTMHGSSPEAIQQEMTKQISEAVSGRVLERNKSDPLGAHKMLTKYSTLLDWQHKYQLEGAVKDSISSILPSAIASEVMAPKGGITAMQEGVKAVESSGGNYSAVGPEVQKGQFKGDHGYGAYQVMGLNVPVWTKQYLGKEMTKEEFLADPAAQDQLFNAITTERLKTHSPRDVASMWFTGHPEIKGDTSNDDYMSAPDYITKFDKAFQKAGGATAQSGFNPDTALGQLSNLTKQATDAAAKQAEALYPGDDVMKQRLVDGASNQIAARYNKQKSMLNDVAQGNLQTVQNAIFVGGDEKLDKSELMQDTGFAAAYNALPAIKQNAVDKHIANHNKNLPPTDAQQENFEVLRGMALTNPRSFMEKTNNSSLAEMDLAGDGPKKLNAMRLAIIKDNNTSILPDVQHAMTLLKDEGVIGDGKTFKPNTDSYHKFFSTLQKSMELYRTENKKAPDDAGIRTMAGSILAQKPRPDAWFGGTNMNFKIDAKSAAAEGAVTAEIGGDAYLRIQSEYHKKNPTGLLTPKQVLNIYRDPANKGLFDAK